MLKFSVRAAILNSVFDNSHTASKNWSGTNLVFFRGLIFDCSLPA